MEFNKSENKIWYEKDGKILAEVTFPAVEANTVDINHTFVDDSLRGQGVAGALLQAVVQELEHTHRKAVCSCSYAKNWFDKHPEKSELLV
ncbi:MAG: GNAT family N-acetyltransferase [Oscillospiraceae bacterium]|nr:GNAT family N-acetyltransferase [Oscillospiraceae bacterium]